jgi:hypothetical protein
VGRCGCLRKLFYKIEVVSDFAKYQNFIACHSFARSDTRLPDELLISTDGLVSTYYAPFDYINAQAEVVICGITPGLQQALLALTEAHKQLKSGKTTVEARRAAKEKASFGGSIRTNLVRMLDYIGLQSKFGLGSCAQLFSVHKHLLHSTQALRYPVFRSGKNYNGNPNMLKHPLLLEQIDRNLTTELRTLPQDAVYVPLGPKVSEVLQYLACRGVLRESQLLAGLPHPSGANAERVAYFLGEKPKASLSEKTNAGLIDAARGALVQKIEAL